MTTVGNGWTCPQCGMFVFFGVNHACGQSFDQADLIAALNRSHAEQVATLEAERDSLLRNLDAMREELNECHTRCTADRDHYKKLAGELKLERDRFAGLVREYEWATGEGRKYVDAEAAEERVARLRAAATDTRLQDAQTVGDLISDAKEALQAAWDELERAEEHHRWHHEQDGREVEPDEDRLRVLLLIGEALESLGADDDEALANFRESQGEGG